MYSLGANGEAMTRRYKVLGHESGDRDGAVADGTIVVHIGGSTAVDAQSIDDAEAGLRKQVAARKLPAGCVYQILPPRDSTEGLRALAVALDGNFRSCFLDTGSGIYSEFRRIRYADSPTRRESEAADLAA